MIGAGVATSHDMAEGVLDRFRSMPVSRLSIVTGQVLGQFSEAVLGLAVYTAIGLICGWRPSFGVGDALAWVGLMLLGTFAFTWAGAYFGMLVRSPDAMQGVGFIIVFPLAFLGGAFVPILAHGRDPARDRRVGSDQRPGRHLAKARGRVPGARLVAALARRAGDGDLVAADAGDLRPARAAPLQQHCLGLVSRPCPTSH